MSCGLVRNGSSFHWLTKWTLVQVKCAISINILDSFVGVISSLWSLFVNRPSGARQRNMFLLVICNFCEWFQAVLSYMSLFSLCRWPYSHE